MNPEFYKLTNKDLELLIEQIRLYEEVFEMKNFKMPDAAFLQTLLEREHIIWR